MRARVDRGRRRKRRVARALALAVACGCCLGSRAHAHFEGALLSSRTASLGDAFVAVADDPSAAVDNPAGLSGIPRPRLLATYQKPFGVAGLDESFLAVSIPARWFTVGVAWFYRGLDDALSENRVTLALARDLKRTSEDASLSIGASVDLLQASAHGATDGSDAAVALGAGVLLRPFAFIGIGYNIRYINQPSLDLVSGGGGTEVPRAQAVGLSYSWQERLTVTAETYEDASGIWRSRGGVELRLGPHVALRGGLEGGRAAAGLGLAWRNVALDAGMLAHEALGDSYVVTLHYAHDSARGRDGSLR